MSEAATLPLLALKIREARLTTGLSQKKFAQRIGTFLPPDMRKPDRFDVMRWENRGDEPRYDTLKAIALASEKEIDFFFRSGSDGASPARAEHARTAERGDGRGAADGVPGADRGDEEAA